MNKYNIYKIKKDNEEALISKLESVGLELVSERKVGLFTLSFFFSREPDEIDIWWVKTYRDFLEGVETPKNRVFYSALLISSKDKSYVISLGKSHFYLRPFCDSDFGLSMAERIVDPDNLKIKNSKFYQSRKSKTITTYHDGIEIDYDSGESMHFLKARTRDEESWGKMASFGNSVQLNLDMHPSELPDLIIRIEQELAKPPLLNLPKVDLVRDEAKIVELNQALVKAILAVGESSDVSVDEFTVSGVNFIFSDTHDYSLFLKGHKREKMRLGELSTGGIIRFVEKTGIDLQETIDDIQVHVHREYGRDYSQPLKEFLDFVGDEDRHCLLDGKWHKFNQSYLKFLQREVDSLKPSYDEKFDIDDTVNEDAFNNERSEKDGFINYDKELTSLDGKYRVEKMDLYKDKTLYFVKIGKLQKLSYAIDQALTTVKILQNRESIIEINGEKVNVESICLWIVLDRKGKIERLSDLNSIIFHMKLVEWKRVVSNAGYDPKIKLNYVY